jgi:hypothetical protein
MQDDSEVVLSQEVPSPELVLRDNLDEFNESETPAEIKSTNMPKSLDV